MIMAGNLRVEQLTDLTAINKINELCAGGSDAEL